MQIRRKIMNEIVGSPRKQKAVAMAIRLKISSGRTSTIQNYNPNKIRKLIGCHSKTFDKYLPLMVEMNLVHFEGINNEHLVVNKLHASNSDRNVDIHRFSFKSFTEVYRSLRAFLFLMLQARKDYVQRTLQIARNPRKGRDFLSAIKSVKRLVKRGVLNSVNDKFEELGLSLKRIAKETGNCVRTAERIVDYATNKRWCKKHTHFEWFEMRGVNYMYVEGFTFTTKNYGFVVKANTYTLSDGMKKCVGSLVHIDGKK